MDIASSNLRMGYIAGKQNTDSAVSPTINTFLPGDIAVADANGALAPTQRTRKRMVTNVQTLGTIYFSVSALAVTINRAGAISFTYWLLYTTSDVGEGIGVQLAFTGVASSVAYSVEAFTNSATRANLVAPAAFGTGVPPYTSGPGEGIVVPCTINIRGSCIVSTPGDLQLQLRSETGSPEYSTLLAPSTVEVSAS